MGYLSVNEIKAEAGLSENPVLLNGRAYIYRENTDFLASLYSDRLQSVMTSNPVNLDDTGAGIVCYLE